MPVVLYASTRRRPRALVLGAAVAAATIVPFAVWSWRPTFDGIFYLMRAPIGFRQDSDSIAALAAQLFGVHLNRSWAVELPEVRFFSVDPGEMDTDMHAAAVPEANRATLARPQDVARRIARMIVDSDRIESGSRVVVTP